MILLTATDESLELVTTAAVSTDWVTSAADITTTAFTPVSSQGNVAIATTTTLVAAPAASTQRQIKLLTIRNAGGANQTVTIQKNKAATVRKLSGDVVLAPGEVLEYLDGRGFVVLDPLGGLKAGVQTDKSAFTEGAGQIVVGGGVFNDVISSDPTEDQAAGVRITAKRALHVNLRGNTGLELGVSGAPLFTKGAVAHDVSGSGVEPLLVGGYANAVAPADVSADQDAVRAWFLRNGAQATVLTAAGALIGGDATNGVDVDVTRVTGTVTVGGVAAHDAAVSGNPVLIGLEGRTTDGTPVTSGDAVRGLADTLGKPIVLVGAVHDLRVNGTITEIDNTADDVIVAAGAGVRIVVTAVMVTNAHATVGTKVEIRDGTTVKIQGFAAATGGGFSYGDGTGVLFVGTANTAVTGRCVTTGADVDINVSGYKIAN